MPANDSCYDTNNNIYNNNEHDNLILVKKIKKPQNTTNDINHLPKLCPTYYNIMSISIEVTRS